MQKIDLKSLNIDEIKNIILDLGEKPFRAKQIFSWLHKKQADSFEDMTDLSKDFRTKLSDKCYISNVKIADKFESSDGTVKYLFELEDNNLIESVLMKYSFGNSVCISTQAGCRMGCSFCASAIGGAARNLTPSEMLSQIYQIQKDTNERVSNVVMMGSGEPLDNFDNSVRFIELVNSEEGLCIGQRHLTLSTCGITDKIYKLADLNFQITLAVSLHAPNDEIRMNIMPVAKKYTMYEIFKAVKYYTEKTKRRVTFEYAMISGVNDKIEYAEELAEKLRGLLCHVNLIPVNDVKEKNYVKSSDKIIKEFAGVLESYNIDTTIRRKLGSDINAACGQLRRSYKSN